MNIRKGLPPLAALALVVAGGFGPASAQMAVTDPVLTVTVQTGTATTNASINAVNGSITGMHTDLARLLQGIGGAINDTGGKISATIEADGNASRSLMVRQASNERLREITERFAVPSTICSESASGGASQVHTAARSLAGDLRPGGAAASNAAVDRAINTPAVNPVGDERRVSAVHAAYCDSIDYAAYGGTQLCPKVSTMPGADKRLASVVSGAGPNGKAPDLTFTAAQLDAARMYMQNSTRRSIGRELSKGEAETPKGIEYVGLRTQYEAVIDAAAWPQQEAIANRTANPATKDLLAEASQNPSAKAYADRTLSPEAKRLHYMSAAEFEAFEVGRRYANTDYQADLQQMSGDNLVREQIRVQALNAWLLLGIKNELHQSEILQGQILASLAHSEYAPLIGLKLGEVNNAMGGK